MLKFDDAPHTPNELVLYWTSSQATRCVLVGTSSGVDLRLVRDGVTVRCTANIDPRFAREIARQWRVEFELSYVRGGARSEAECPECGDDEASVYRGLTGEQRRYCRSCGHDWPSRVENRT